MDRAVVEELVRAAKYLTENVIVPDKRCNCIVNPPCSDCVEYGGLREAMELTSSAITAAERELTKDDTDGGSVMSEIQGFDARAYPSPMRRGEDSPAETAILLTVLVKGAEDRVRAYQGIVPDTSRQDPRYRASAAWVRENGVPLRYAEAARIWPGLTEQEYAR